MKFEENPIFGRKVFFLNPPFNVEKKVIENLKEREYEVYVLKDYLYAKSVLRYFDHAICFIDIDRMLSIKQWYNFIKSFEYDSSLGSIFLGILATKTPEQTIQKFIMNLNLPGGYVPLAGATTEEITEKICAILELNGAKGKRKYLSLTCNKEDALTGYIAFGSKLYTMTFENISSIGISCFLDDDLSKLLVKNTLLTNVCLSLGRWSVICECIVYSINVFEGKVTALLLFAKGTPKDTKDSLRKFIYDVLNKNLSKLISSCEADRQNYSALDIPEDDKSVPDFNAPTEEDSTVDNVEEIDTAEDENNAAPENTAENAENESTDTSADTSIDTSADTPETKTE